MAIAASRECGMSARKPRTLMIEVPVHPREDALPLLERLTVRVPDAAQILSISRAAVYRLLNEGEIEASKSGQKTLIIVESLKGFIERNRRSLGPRRGESL